MPAAVRLPRPFISTGFDIAALLFLNSLAFKDASGSAERHRPTGDCPGMAAELIRAGAKRPEKNKGTEAIQAVIRAAFETTK